MGILSEQRLSKFLPILFEEDNRKCEGLVETFDKDQFVLHVEPFNGAENKTDIEFMIDMPHIVPEEKMVISIDNIDHEKHNNRDEYIRIQGKIANMPEKLQEFFTNVFGVTK